MRSAKRNLLLSAILFFVFSASTLCAQGGIGNMPRTDLVMLSAVTRDSLADELLAKIEQLRSFAQQNKLDSAGFIIAYDGGKEKVGKWARAVNLGDAEEKARVVLFLDKLNKLYATSPQVHHEYFAAFKDKDNPAGMMLLYQIKYVTGKTSHMVSYRFYPIGDVLMLGEIQ